MANLDNHSNKILFQNAANSSYKLEIWDKSAWISRAVYVKITLMISAEIL